MKRLAFVLLAMLVASSYAAPKLVKSKRGGVDLAADRSLGKVVCTADFNDEMPILKDEGNLVFVKAACGNGWVEKSKLEYVAEGPGDKTIKMGEVDISVWIDNNPGVFILENDIADFDGVEIDRDFKEYLQHTVDRESMEMSHNEN